MTRRPTRRKTQRDVPTDNAPDGSAMTRRTTQRDARIDDTADGSAMSGRTQWAAERTSGQTAQQTAERVTQQSSVDDTVVDGPRVLARRRARRRRGVPPVVYFVTAGVLVLAVVIAGVAVLLTGGGHKKSAAPAPRTAESGLSPSAYSSAPSTSAFAAIADRTADKRPLSAAEVFGTKTISDPDAKASLRLGGSRLDRQCAAAVWGQTLALRLQQAGCAEATRGVYTDKHFTAMVTIFDLATANGANQVVAAADPESGGGFPRPLGAQFSQGFSTARGVAMGHYAVITWVQRTTGTGNETDPQLLSLLVATARPEAVLSRAADAGKPS